jgi:thiol-disulfide isomerase/thioredoxin
MVTEITMQEMTNSQPIDDGKVRLVMFYGPTCGPCKATMPHYEEVSDFFQSRGANIECLKINAWEPAEQATYCRETWNINGVPTFKAFCHGQQIVEKVGGGDLPTMQKFMHDIVDEVFKRFQEKI